jgi:DNA-directed RNA polymerase specialized sigma24 family protein
MIVVHNVLASHSSTWIDATDTGTHRATPDQDQRISEVVRRNQARLRSFIRRSVPEPGDAEDILQDVFFDLVVAAEAPTKPIG